ncbi:SGNH hydrolase-type esterase domain-containing protein [Gongronella butleri]|nr:SGNH hydrolase-type esterase domain-containing protein [Gongronella butleri]
MELYSNVRSFQVLQRDVATNTATALLKNGKTRILGVGGPYKIDNAHDVYVGDVWVLAGQSNMRGYGYFDDAICKKYPEPVHAFVSREVWTVVPSDEPIHRLAESPRAVHRQLPDPTVRDPGLANIRGYSLVPAFAHVYKRETGMPVGVIACAHGGTSIDQWLPSHDKDNSLYGAMVNKVWLAGGRIKGVLWYQGESDTPNGTDTIDPTYRTKMDKLLKAMERDFNLPLVVSAQISRTIATTYDATAKHALDEGWHAIRKTQAMFAEDQRHAVVPTITCPLDDFIHVSARGLADIGCWMALGAASILRSRQQVNATKKECGVYQDIGVGIFYPQDHKVMLVDRLVREGYQYMHHLLKIPIGFEIVTTDGSEDVHGFSIHRHTIVAPDGNFVGPSTIVDMIYSARIGADGCSVELMLTSKAYNEIRASLPGNQFQVHYGYGQNPHCNLISKMWGVPLGAARQFSNISIA